MTVKSLFVCQKKPVADILVRKFALCFLSCHTQTGSLPASKKAPSKLRLPAYQSRMCRMGGLIHRGFADSPNSKKQSHRWQAKQCWTKPSVSILEIHPYLFSCLDPKFAKTKTKKHPWSNKKLVHICLVWKTHRAFYILRSASCGWN